mmetsp:Transcript_108212/g.191621  ORF Transcript_108212/g.191621 Transcript_108212/m.191621 type:complete len:405 (-) Transcript_108212:70-1284(-)
MYRIAVVVTCLACAGHGQRGHRSGRSLGAESLRNPAQVLADFLVQLNPAAAFKSLGPHAAALKTRYQTRQASPSMSGFENPSLLTFSKKGQVTIGLGPDLKPTDTHFEPTWEEGTPVYGAVAVPLPMGMVFEESPRFDGRFEIMKVEPKTNAAEAGLRAGDLIRATIMSSEDSQTVFNTDDQEFDSVMDALKSNAEAGHTVLVIERNVAPRGTITVCTGGMTCKKFKGFNSKHAIDTFRAMATTHKGVALENEEHIADKAAAELQQKFAEDLVSRSKCFNRCGRGVSVYNSWLDDVDKEIDSVPKVLTTLKSLGLNIPTATSIACLRRFNAMKKIEEGKKDEALQLLTDAIKAAKMLGVQGAALAKSLYEERADLQEEMGDADAAKESRTEAESMMELKFPVAG